uniref:C2H2-type domain-containing protein n=1 Tax=Anopheles christyi TaxID=43041 RepID=A0A182K598_9DIPT
CRFLNLKHFYHQLLHPLSRLPHFQIQIDDLLPKCICGSCYLKLESIDQFALMANRTEEAFRAWLGRLRGLNCPAEAAKNVNVMLPLFRLDPDGGSDTKKGNILFQAKDASNNNNPSPSVHTSLSSNGAASMISPPEKGIISYSDLKLGLLIKDQELLKLILKALKWAENDRRASFEVLIQRLKNSSFREILSNRNLLNDSDLTQLLKSYIGQGVMNSLAATPAGGAPLNNNVVPSTTVLFQSPPNPTVDVKPVNLTHPQSVLRFVPPVATTIAAGVNVNEYRIDEASVTQMEVGVDPDLYFPYEDEDSSGTTRYEGRLEDRQENTVTIKLVTTNVAGDLIENKRMIPAILNVRGNKRFQCSACPECFETNGELQQHIVRRHLPRTNRTVITEQGKPAIKIRVRKNKPIPIPSLPPKLVAPSPPVLPTSSPIAPTTSDSPSSPMKIVPLKIPASTTITVVPAPYQAEPVKPPSEPKVDIKPVVKKEPLEDASPAKEELAVRKSKRKSSLKPEVSSLVLEKQRKRKVKKEGEHQAVHRTSPPPPPPPAPQPQPKVSRKTNAAPFCALCRKKLTARETMRDHMQQEHSRYECEKCDRAFKSAVNLNRHQQYHAASVQGSAVVPATQQARASKSKQPEEQTHKCSYCEKAFKRNHHLKVCVLYCGNCLQTCGFKIFF